MSLARSGVLAATALAALLLAPVAASGAPGDGDRNRDGTAASGGVHIDARLGFSGTFRPGRWTPLRVTVSNRGAPVSGRLEVVTIDGDEFRRILYPVRHERDLELGRDARRRFHFTVYLETLGRPLEIRVLDGTRVLASRSLDLRPRFTPARLVLAVSRDADLDYLNDGGTPGLRVLYPHPDQLPHAWQGYDAVEALVLHGLSLESLEASQFDALTRWIARGGVLAVSGGPDYALLSTPRLGSLLPATPTGITPLDDAAAVGATLGAPLTASRPFHVNRVGRVRGEVLHGVNGVPLVIESRHGRGRVLYLTFDVSRYPFERWDGMKTVWARLLGTARDERAPVHRGDDRSSAPALLRLHAADFPGHGTLLMFCALYLCVLATAYRVRGATSPRLRTAAAVAILVPGLFAPAAYALFGRLLFEPGASATMMSVIEPLPASRFAALRVDLGIHGNRTGRLVLQHDGATTVFRAPLDARGLADGAGWRMGPARVEPEAARPYTLHLLEGRDTIAFDVEASVSPEAELSVRNDSGRPIRDAWLVMQGSAWFLGDLEPDARARFDLSAPPDVGANDRDEWWTALARDPRVDRDRLRVTVEILSRKADGREEGTYPGRGHALLMGYTGAPLRLRGASAGWRRTELTLVLLRFPARLPSPAPVDETNETT